MAFAPCTVHGGRFAGKSSSFYVALLQGTDRKRTIQRCCPDCALKFHDWAVAHLSLVTEGTEFFEVPQRAHCQNCNDDLVDEWAMFVNEYMRNQPERQFYGNICGTCVGAVAFDWGIA